MSFSRRGKTRAASFLSMVMLGFFAVALSVYAQSGGALYLSPSSAGHAVGDTFSVSVRVSTGGQAINAAEGSLVFDPAKVQVTSISKSGSIFTLWTTEPSYSNSDGTIAFGGGLPSPGYSGAAGQIITLNFKAKAAGSSDVVLVSGDILANDGSGTNILDSLGKGTYPIGGAGSTPTPAPGTPTASLSAPSISSTTHPDPTKWYRNSDPVLSWQVPSGATEVRLVVARQSTAVPRVRYIPAINQKSLPDTADGVWYFNAQFANASGVGPVGSFRFNIDTHPPILFTVSRIDSADSTNPQPQILFSTSDALSGIDHYEIQIDQGVGIAVPVASAGHAYTLPKQVPGSHTITVKATDGAGNSTSQTLAVIVDPIVPPVITQAPEHAASDISFTVHGRGTPGTSVLLYARSTGQPIFALASVDDTTGRIGRGTVDDHGDWTIHTNPLDSGSYMLSAYSQDSRGALSNPSNSVTVIISFQLFNAIIHFIRTFANAILLALLIAVLIMFSLWAYRRRDKKGPAPLKKVEKGASVKLRAVLDDIEDEIALLDRIVRNRPLYPEERYLRNKLVQYRKTIKFLVTDTHSRLAKKK